MFVFKRVVYFIILLCAACNLSQTATTIGTPTVEPVLTIDASTPTSEIALSTYSNSAYGYSVQYQAGLTLEGEPDSQYVWIDKQIYIHVGEFNPEQPMGDAPVIETAQNTMIGAFTARRLSGYVGAVGGGTPQRYEAFVIEHNKMYYQFIAYELKRDDVQAIDRTMGAVPQDVVTLLTQIVTSLRFTN